jgi:hypothetical protein
MSTSFYFRGFTGDSTLSTPPIMLERKNCSAIADAGTVDV